jgi:GNAT superfamily N-acetyltransferase
LVDLISKQMAVIGGNTDKTRIRSSLDNALKSGSRGRFFLWYSADGRLGAFAFANVCSGLESSGDYLWANELYVGKDYRRKKVATQILNFMEDWSKKQNIRHIACSTGLMNDPARRLFENNAFELSETIWVDKIL